MQNLSLPTDNIYKFYSIFGLVIIVSSIYAFINLLEIADTKTLELGIKVMELDAKLSKSELEQALLDVYNNRGKITVKNRDYFSHKIAYILAFGILITIYGLIKWQFKVQKLDDELRELQKKVLQSQLDSNNAIQKTVEKNVISSDG